MKIFRTGMAALIIVAGVTAGPASQAHSDDGTPGPSPQQIWQQDDERAAEQADLLAFVQLLLLTTILAQGRSGAGSVAAGSDDRR
jgi:hypothetical protein